MSALYARQWGPVLHITGWQLDAKKDAKLFKDKLLGTTTCSKCGTSSPTLFQPDPGRTIEVVRRRCDKCGAIVEAEAGSDVEGWHIPSRREIDQLNRRYQLLIGVTS